MLMALLVKLPQVDLVSTASLRETLRADHLVASLVVQPNFAEFVEGPEESE